MVEPGHGGEPLVGHVRGVVHGDQRVGVGRVADHEDAQVFGGVLVERQTLHREDGTIGLEQVLALHALAAGPRADQKRHVGAVERHVRVVAEHHRVDEGERTVVDLHRHALEGAHGGRDLEQLQDHRLVGAEQLAAGNAEDEGVADLACGAGDGDSDWGGAHVGS